MTISTLIRKTIAAGDGVTTNFNFNFQVRTAADLQVYYTDATGVQTLLASNAYTVVLNPIPSGQLWSAGGTITYPLAGSAIAIGTTLTIARNVALLQSSSLINQGGYYPDVVEAALDVLTMEMQQINETIGRALTLPISSSASTALPNPIAGAAIGWDVTGTFITNILNAANIAVPVAVSQGGTGAVAGSAALAALGALGFAMLNGTLVASVAASALTIAIKTKAGADPSAADSVTVIFRNSASATGDYTQIVINQATSIVVPSTATLGTSNATAFRFWVVGFNDAGTFRLGVVNCLSGTSIMALRDDILASASNPVANLAQTIYANAAVAAKPMRILGYLEYSAGLAAAGTYNIVPTKLNNRAPGDTLPGQVVQTQRTDTGAVATGTTAIAGGDTVPQITEGDQYMSQAITPIGAPNILETRVQGAFTNNTAGSWTAQMMLFRDAIAAALATTKNSQSAAASAELNLAISNRVLAGSTAATTLKIREGSGGNTNTFNGFGGARKAGGTLNSYIQVDEVMA